MIGPLDEKLIAYVCRETLQVRIYKELMSEACVLCYLIFKLSSGIPIWLHYCKSNYSHFCPEKVLNICILSIGTSAESMLVSLSILFKLLILRVDCNQMSIDLNLRVFCIENCDFFKLRIYFITVSYLWWCI